MKELFVAGSLSSIIRIIVYLKVVREEINSRSCVITAFILELIEKLGHLFNTIIHRPHHPLLSHSFKHRFLGNLQQFLRIHSSTIFNCLSDSLCCLI
jgi:hypothetical protein